METTLRNVLMKILEDLIEEELKKFKFQLEDPPLKEFGPMPRGQLHPAQAVDLAELLIGHYGVNYAVEVTKAVLEIINHRDLAEKLEQAIEKAVKSQKTEDPDQDDQGPEDPNRKSQKENPVSQPLGEATSNDYRDIYIAHLREKMQAMDEEDAPFRPSQGYLQLQLEPLRQCNSSSISLETLFDSDTNTPNAPQTVVLQGPAGIGKSTLARKVLQGWVAGSLYPDRFDYTFYIGCQEASLLREKSVDHLITVLCGNNNAPVTDILKQPQKLLFVLDGLDELQFLSADQSTHFHSRVKEKESVHFLLGGLIQKELLPQSTLLITIRPPAQEKLGPWLMHPRYVKVLGFSQKQKKEYFYLYFMNGDLAKKAFDFVQTNKAISDECCAPLMCWIICSWMKQRLKQGKSPTKALKNRTDIYMAYISTFLPTGKSLSKPTQHVALQGLCSLATEGIQRQKILFTEGDLRRHSLDGVDTSFVLNVSSSKAGLGGTMLYSFRHLSFQEFFNAMFYLLEEKISDKESQNLKQLMEKQETSGTVQFLHELLKKENEKNLELKFNLRVSLPLKKEVEMLRRRVEGVRNTLSQIRRNCEERLPKKPISASFQMNTNS
ncbi:NACHT, LRR and PYD domains-containing protein 10-like [Trichosurus vulpecula]|uniref:NACHT, LRR and PYD domains-containing protein 10-like n=1 Tax=Trichosurus vulpecula TaxID=9337 RepID=UPI00186B0C43|nr:NACHT, LRR and PYD domains-containing protein 10-like [Trichosurus vulpecula]